MNDKGMTASDRLVALVGRKESGPASRHYAGLPPLGSGAPDTRLRMAIPRVLVLSTRPDGIFLDRFDELGEEVGDTWHESIEDAKAQAFAEYGETIGGWTPVPDEETDPVTFALRLEDE